MKKNKVKCPNGHFYNSDIYDDCPICTNSFAPKIEEVDKKSNTSSDTPDKVSTLGVFDTSNIGCSQKKTEEPEKEIVKKEEEPEKESVKKTEPEKERVKKEKSESKSFFSLNLNKKNSNKKSNSDSSKEIGVSKLISEFLNNKNNAAQTSETKIEEIPTPLKEKPIVKDEPQKISLQKEIMQVQAQSNLDIATQAVFNPKKQSNSPVAGWLVCIEGNHTGEAFEIFAGNNFIGRSETMNITLKSDLSVSRNKHCKIIYEPNKSTFYLSAGESEQLTYLNENILLVPKEIKFKDIISIGNSKLMFMPLCDSKFNWNSIGEDF
ncbi:MAG: FHA domain-containing protein [Clostridia bacterium]